MSKEIADRLEAWRNGLDRQSRLDLRDVTRIDEFIAALRTPPPPPDAPTAESLNKARTTPRMKPEYWQDQSRHELVDELCQLERSLASMTQRCAELEKATPTPDSLRKLAAWFDSPAEYPPSIWIEISGSRCTAGYALRRIAEAMEEPQ